MSIKRMLFKEEKSGVSKKSGEPYRFIVLHDPEILENISFFVDPDAPISTTGLKLGDEVQADIDFTYEFGRPKLTLNDITL